MKNTHIHTLRIASYEVVDHGIDNSQYFQGCGTSHTEFDHVATGCGSNALEALDDACEQIATAHEGSIDFANLDNGPEFATARTKRAQRFDVHAYLVRHGEIKRGEDMPEECDLYYYASIRYTLGASDDIALLSAGLHASQTR